MKKSMKFKRYDEGGEVADKEAGLKASKGEDVGFFQRLRMGNIDDPNSEAYKRFGAGRGRSEASTKQEETAPMPVARPTAQPNPIFEEGRKQGMRQPSGDASVAEEYSGPRTKPIVSTPSEKPSASKPSMSAMDRSRDQAARNALGEGSYRPSAPSVVKKTETEPSTSIMKQKPVTTAETFDANSLSNFAKPKAKAEEAPKSTYKKNATSASSGRNSGVDKEKGEPSTYKKNSTYAPSGRNTGMKSGGSVSSASRRADGIASKGKTRCKIC
jgi:hypothetical protein